MANYKTKQPNLQSTMGAGTPAATIRSFSTSECSNEVLCVPYIFTLGRAEGSGAHANAIFPVDQRAEFNFAVFKGIAARDYRYAYQAIILLTHLTRFIFKALLK